MSLNREEVQHIATLCRIGMTENDLTTLPQQLSQMLDLFAALQEANTDELPPTGHSASLETVLRADETRPSHPLHDVLTNAPSTDGDQIKVKVVLEE